MVKVKEDLAGKRFGYLQVIKQAEEKYFGEWSYDNSVSCKICITSILMLIRNFRTWLSRIKCNHEYQFYYSHMINSGMGKVICYKCCKCEKQIYKYI